MWADAEGLDDFQRHRQRAVAKLDGDVAGFVGRERTADDAAVADGGFDPGRADDDLVNGDGEDLVEVAGGVGLKALGGVGLQVELDHGRAERVEADAGIAQVAAAQHGLGGVGGENGSFVDELEAGVDDEQLAGLAEQADGLVRVLDAGQFHDQAVVAFDLDQRLGDAERVDAVLDDALHGVHVAVLQLLFWAADWPGSARAGRLAGPGPGGNAGRTGRARPPRPAGRACRAAIRRGQSRRRRR